MPKRYVDVSQEALIRGWPRLRRWLDEDRPGLRLYRRITEAAEEWNRSDRDSDLLYRGTRLVQAQEWRERNEPELNALEREFMDASMALKQRLEQQEKERQQRELDAALKLAEKERQRADVESRARRRQLYLIIVLFGLLIAGLFATIAFWQKGEAEKQTNLAQTQAILARAAEEKTRAAEEKIHEVASRANVTLARYSIEAGNDARGLAQLALASKRCTGIPSGKNVINFLSIHGPRIFLDNSSSESAIASDSELFCPKVRISLRASSTLSAGAKPSR